VTLQCLEKWLEAATDGAAKDATVNLDLAHSRRPFYSLGGRGAKEPDLHTPYTNLLGHLLRL
jgi:hypothetical protein